MFTGLIEDVGEVVGTVPVGNGRRIRVRTGIELADVALGDSIAVNGACLTAEALDSDVVEVVAGKETIQRTTVGELRPGSRVHLERALRLGDRLDGHMVQGHVDGMGKIVRSYGDRETHVLWVDLPDRLSRYVAEKGSICIDGVSLTVNEVSGTTFRVNVVPYTADATLLGARRPGERVNIEVDVLAKYVERLLGTAPGADKTWEQLQRLGVHR